MKTRKLIEALQGDPKKLHIMGVPDHFHVTEIGVLTKNFVDCGGIIHYQTSCSIQIWVANDVDHRLPSDKLLKILEMANEKFYLSELPVTIEYGEYVAAQYSLVAVHSGNEGILNFELEGIQTTCLAPDKCGIEESCCEGSGCC